MKKSIKKLVMLTILGVSVLSSNTLSSVSEYSNYSQENGIANKRLLKLANNNQKDELSSMSYVDNYIPQERNEAEFNEEIMLEENDAIYNLYASTNEYTDNGHKDDHPSGATKINYQNGTITGTLNTNDGWTQFWNNVGERDEDYFRFTLPEKLKMNFSYSGPVNYNMRILDYEKEFICTSQSKIEIELNPGTYYLHVYTNETASIIDQNYVITYSNFRISNKTNLLLTNSTKSKYKMALWENEVYPKNGVRYTKKEQTLKYIMKPRRGTTAVSGYVDPLFLSNEDNETLTDQVYLESILYAWGEKELKDLYEVTNGMFETLNEAINQKKARDLKIQMYESVGSLFLTVAGFIPAIGDTVNLFSTILSIRSDAANIVQYYFSSISDQELNDFQIGFTIGNINGILAAAISDKNNTNNIVIKIPRYFYFKKVNGNVGNNTLKTYSWKVISTIFQGAFDNAFTYLHSTSSINYLQSFNGNDYYGNIIPFDDNQKYNDYISGKGDGTSLGTHTIHEYNNVKDSDANNHILFCDCGYQKLEKHKNYYDTESGTYSCEYCGHKYSVVSNSISKEKYGYTNEYNLSPIDEYIMGGDGKAILTKRLRCAYVDNYLVMSAKSNDANLAYLEYDFDYQVVEFNYNIALWSDDESLIRNSSIRLEYYNNGWKIKRTFNPKEMSLDKNNLMNYKDIFESGATKVRFIIRTNLVQNSNNRGRMVIGDIDYKYGV